MEGLFFNSQVTGLISANFIYSATAVCTVFILSVDELELHISHTLDEESHEPFSSFFYVQNAKKEDFRVGLLIFALFFHLELAAHF